jgi:hypothetical protein
MEAWGSRSTAAQVAMLANHGAAYFAVADAAAGGSAGPSPGRQGNAHRSIVPYQVRTRRPGRARSLYDG